MATSALTREESFGLALAALGHIALVWVLVTARPPEALPPPERVSVTLSDETGAVSTSPKPQSDPVADKGPELGEPAPVPEVVVAPPPPPAPAPPQNTPPPKPPQQAKATPPKATPAKVNPPPKAGASILDSSYSKGLQGGSAKGKDQTPPASQASAQQVSSWSSLIGSKVRGPWLGCPVNGLDANKLRATVRFTLDPSGRVVSIEPFDVTGITDANRPQAKPFKDCAIRAIKLAAPFTGLPPEFHDQWKARKLNFSKQ